MRRGARIGPPPSFPCCPNGFRWAGRLGYGQAAAGSAPAAAWC